MIQILYFARLREQLGTAGEQLDLPPDVSTVADLIAFLAGRGGIWADALTGGETLMTAVNHEMARADSSIRDGDEVGIFPPVTGG